MLDHGFVRLDGALASDPAVVNGARVSFNQASQEMSDRDAGPIRFLMRERHGTPFEHGYFRFIVKAPLFVVREHHRHRAGSYNEWSGRYSKMEPEFYVPENVRTQVGKPGSYSFDPVTSEIAETTREELANVYATTFRPTSAWSSWASRGSWPAACSPSARTPSSTGRSTRGRS